MPILLTSDDEPKHPLTCSFVVQGRPGVTLFDHPDVHQMCTSPAQSKALSSSEAAVSDGFVGILMPRGAEHEVLDL